MNKKKIIIIIISSVIVLLLAALLVYLNYQKNSALKSSAEKLTELAEPMTKEERNSLGLSHIGDFVVTARDKKGKVADYKMIGVRELEPIALEWMSDAEKIERNIDVRKKIQVIEKDANGKIISYRVVEKEYDVIKEY